jgi:hypothetical protein
LKSTQNATSQEQSADAGPQLDEVIPLRKTDIRINAIGTYQNTSILEFDVDRNTDQPWRKPGADITDYFNYGFNEHTWRLYCVKQKELRDEMGGYKYGASHQSQQHQSKGFDETMDEMGIPKTGQYEASYPQQQQQPQSNYQNRPDSREDGRKRQGDDRSDYSRGDYKRRRDHSRDSRDDRRGNYDRDYNSGGGRSYDRDRGGRGYGGGRNNDRDNYRNDRDNHYRRR